MSIELQYRPEFEHDVRDASIWYENRVPGLGRRFETALQRSLIGETPAMAAGITLEPASLADVVDMPA